MRAGTAPPPHLIRTPYRFRPSWTGPPAGTVTSMARALGGAVGCRDDGRKWESHGRRTKYLPVIERFPPASRMQDSVLYVQYSMCLHDRRIACPSRSRTTHCTRTEHTDGAMLIDASGRRTKDRPSRIQFFPPSIAASFMFLMTSDLGRSDAFSGASTLFSSGHADAPTEPADRASRTPPAEPSRDGQHTRCRRGSDRGRHRPASPKRSRSRH